MKVLNVIPSLDERDGGPSKAMVMIASALHQALVEVEVVTTVTGGQMRLDVSTARVHHLKRTLATYKFANGFRSWLRQRIRNYELIHAHALFSFLPVSACWLARRMGVPYVIRPLGVLNRYGVTRRRSLLKRLSLWLIEGPLLRDAAAVHFTDFKEWEEAQTLEIPMRGVVIPLAAPILELDLSMLARDPNRVLFLSRLDPKKNIEALLEAISLLRVRYGKLQLVIAGDGSPDYVERLKRLVSELNLDSTIDWVGHVEGKAKAREWARASVFVLPSLSENFGIAAVEAMQAGLPAVLGKGVAIAEKVADANAGLAVEPTPEAIAEAIEVYLKDSERALRDGQNGVALVKQEYSLERMGNRLEKLYQSILAAPDRRWHGGDIDA